MANAIRLLGIRAPAARTSQKSVGTAPRSLNSPNSSVRLNMMNTKPMRPSPISRSTRSAPSHSDALGVPAPHQGRQHEGENGLGLKKNGGNRNVYELDLPSKEGVLTVAKDGEEDASVDEVAWYLPLEEGNAQFVCGQMQTDRCESPVYRLVFEVETWYLNLPQVYRLNHNGT